MTNIAVTTAAVIITLELKTKAYFFNRKSTCSFIVQRYGHLPQVFYLKLNDQVYGKGPTDVVRACCCPTCYLGVKGMSE